MKKSIIAASAASLAVAALPIAGVFAATGNSFTDTLTVGVQGGCTMEDAETTDPDDPADPGTYVDRTFSDTIAAGTVGYLNADGSGVVDPTSRAFTVACNTAGTTGHDTWNVTISAGNLAVTGDESNRYIEPGSSFTGNKSAWGILSNASGTTTANPYGADYTGYTAANSTFLSAAIENKVTFNPSYKVYVAPNQAVGDYTGVVTYTVTLP